MVNEKLKPVLEKLREDNIAATKKAVKSSVKKDHMIIQAADSLYEIDKAANMLAKRLREWYEYYNPEFSKSIEGHEKFAELILTKTKRELLAEIRLSEADSMGADIPKVDLDAILALAARVNSLYNLRKQLEQYIEDEMKKLSPNMTAVAGGLVGAKLLSHAGSLKRLAMLPACTIQILGAEKALFRHMKFKARAPKHGVILQHPLLQKAQNKGRAARAIADKISIAVKVDYFKGKFIGDRLRNELEKKLA
jgi:nucleolar protein 56